MFTRENPSPRYKELLALYKSAHHDGLPHQGIKPEKTFSGGSLARALPTIEDLVNLTNSKTLLDYGCGKARYHRSGFSLNTGLSFANIQGYLGVDHIQLYDPAVPEYSVLPEGQFDGVFCVDVLEHCPESDISWILDELFSFAKKFIYANVASYPAKKILANGENAHCTQKPVDWWGEQLVAISKRHSQKLFRVDVLLEAPSLSSAPAIKISNIG